MTGKLYLYHGPGDSKLTGWSPICDVLRDRWRHPWYEQAFEALGRVSDALEDAMPGDRRWAGDFGRGFGTPDQGPWLCPVPMWGKDSDFIVAWRHWQRAAIVIASPVPLPWLDVKPLEKGQMEQTTGTNK